MGLRWKDISELVIGMIWEGRIDRDAISPKYIYKTYRSILEDIQSGTDKADVLVRYYSEITGALKVMETSFNLAEDEIVDMLITAYEREIKRRILDEQLARLEAGEDIDLVKIQKLIEAGSVRQYNTMYDILNNKEVHGWRSFYYSAIDDYLGDPSGSEKGLPESSLVIIAGSPASGKTSLIAKMISEIAKHGGRTLFYSLEMTDTQAARRILQASVSGLSPEEQERIIISDSQMTAAQIYTEAMQICAQEDIHSIYIDFADYLVPNKEDESEVGYTYRMMAQLAKYNKSKAPVVLLSQLNRRYTEGIPRINAIRWSSLAEALASVIILVHNPTANVHSKVSKEDSLPPIRGVGYLIIGKSRFGYPMGSVGAVQVTFDGKTSWGEPMNWIPINS